MKAALFAFLIALGAVVFADAFQRGAQVPVPPPLQRRVVTFLPTGYELRLDGLSVQDEWKDELKERGVSCIVDERGQGFTIGTIRGSKLTQGSKLLLRVGQPMDRYREVFPRAPRTRRWSPQMGVLLEVAGTERIESITLSAAPGYRRELDDQERPRFIWER